MEDKEQLAELQAGLKEQGVEATQEEIQAAVEKLQAGELTEDNLEEVAGGVVIGPIGNGLTTVVMVRLMKCMAVCPKCHKAYIKVLGHSCNKKKTIMPLNR